MHFESNDWLVGRVGGNGAVRECRHIGDYKAGLGVRDWSLSSYLIKWFEEGKTSVAPIGSDKKRALAPKQAYLKKYVSCLSSLL